ncbi:Structural maintenance of chromosomes protein [Aphelenchoides fujianensis]|nr:Structural maintenance of chromosomes protein [Aphelenchoides fujianensis]
MYIREINITGFRSYFELTSITDLSRKHNVVVGRNGSGKSNFFYAIQFVLSNEFNNLNQEQRNNLLHEGTGQRVAQAKVEIVFDNSLHRLPSDSNEVRIARVVTSKKDQYLIDGKTATRADSAGISRSNPYYIVKQGKVMELATAADAQRLKLIKEVAGTKVFDERKEESMKLLEETQGKLAKCEQLLGYMGERLKKLEEEKEDLKEYQKFDRQKRAIEYTINALECNEAERKCDRMSSQREQLNNEQNVAESAMMDVQQNILSHETQLRKLETRYKGFRDELERLTSEKTELMERMKSVESAAGATTRKDDLTRLRAEIAQHQQELEELVPRFERLVEEENKLQTDIKINDQKCKEMNAKLGRKDQFKTVEERDKYLKREINTNEKQKTDIERQVEEIQRSIQDDEEETRGLHETQMNLERDLHQQSKLIEDKNKEFNAKRVESAAAHGVMKEAMLKENETLDELAILKFMRENNANNQYTEVLNGYYGHVVDHINCDPQYFAAVEVTGENRLFNHVVQTDRVAMEILKLFNEHELRGEVNFFPLNRVVVKPCRSVTDLDAAAMLDYIQYDQKYDAVMRQLFAETAIVPDLTVGARVSRNDRFNCVTIDGDTVNRRGPLTGGYMDRKRSKLEAAINIRTLKAQLPELEAKVQRDQAASASAKERYDQTLLDLQQLESELNHLRSAYRELNEKKRSVSDQLNRRSNHVKPKQDQVLHLRELVRSYVARKEMLEQQLGTALESQLTEDEQTTMERLQEEINQWTARLETVVHERVEVARKKTGLEHRLHSNLLRRRDDLESKMQDRSVEDKRDRLLGEQEQQKQLRERLSKINQRIIQLEEHLSDYNQENDDLSGKMEELQEKKRKLDEEIEKIAKQTDAFCTKMAELQLKRDDFSRKMNEVGSISHEVLVKYQNLNLKQLDKKLTECLNELKKYENVNKKALDQFVRAKNQKDSLQKNVEDLKQNENSIKSLIEVLDARRHETLHLTFKQVAKNFNELFRRLIEGGTAHLVMKQMDDVMESQDSSSQSTSIQQDSVDRFIGIGNAQFITTTFRSELLEHAEKYYGVRFRNKVSYIDPVTREEAYDFIQDDATHT